MSGLDRRRLLCLSMAILPALASRPALAQAASDGRTIVPPAQPMVYSRRLERSLAGGAQVVVERSFAVRFIPQGAGFLVEGEQIAALVDMPETLAPLAQLERERVETAIFPLELDRAGRIRVGAGPEPGPAIEAALRHVTQTLDALVGDEEEQRTAIRFVSAFHQAGTAIVSSLPADLFAPVDMERSQRRTVDLPAGGQGMVETRFAARLDPRSGLMRNARREIVTTIGEDTRRTTELFTLAH